MSVGAPPNSSSQLPDRTANFAREFLSALFMSLRTAQIHDPTNQAYQMALSRLHQSAEALYAATGGFVIRILDDAFFVNGARLTFDQGSNAAMRTLRALLEAQSLGGFTIESNPTVQGLLELISLVANRGTDLDGEGGEEELRKLNISLLGPQRLVDGTSTKVDRGAVAVHTYAKLMLAIRDRLRQLRPGDTSESLEAIPGEIRAVRVVQDLVELVSERIDLLLQLATNTQGGAPEELHGANACVLSVALGYSAGFHRRDLGDLGVAALFHHLGPYVVPGDPRQHDMFAAAALSHTLAESGVGRSLYTRAMILAEQQTSSGTGPRKAHPFSRTLRVAAAYSRLVLGYGVSDGVARTPIDALSTMQRDPTGWLDPKSVDLLINLLRAFPPGSQVVLDSGQYAVVSTPLNIRWDRPIVRVASRPPKSVDLMTQDSSARYVDHIVGTQKFLGAQPAQGQATAAPPTPAIDLPVPVPLEQSPTIGPRSALTGLPTSSSRLTPLSLARPRAPVDDLMLSGSPSPASGQSVPPGPMAPRRPDSVPPAPPSTALRATIRGPHGDALRGSEDRTGTRSEERTR